MHIEAQRLQNNRLCVVEAKCIGLDRNGSRRAKVLEQTSSYAVFLSQEVGCLPCLRERVSDCAGWRLRHHQLHPDDVTVCQSHHQSHDPSHPDDVAACVQTKSDVVVYCFDDVTDDVTACMQTKSDVVAYCFDDQGGEIALESR